MKEIFVSIVVWINRNNEVHLQTRNEEGLLNNFLEFPGGKIEKGELPIDAARREFIEETNYPLTESATLLHFKDYCYTYPDRKVKLHVFILKDDILEKQCNEWYPLEFSPRILKANEEIFNDLRTSQI